ncbi:hypothetical protein CLV84_0855 [Neolewinella xylanilytica]|uniref:Uncharacterized protein n=1 Tax=Neolewinella xylanilytica TaxID=1514080 RepID=A0A2S6I8R8_9BACT|nr:hypothetical protein [Neolewinella xylanilytica]PPK87896.1 hypothetical protein CLV84_0855 [Neolewinella xylanilytica]
MESRELQEFENDLIELTDIDLVDRYNDDLATDAWKDAPTGYSEVMLREFQSRDLDISAITDGDTLLYNTPVVLDDGVLRPERDVTDRI